MRLRLRLFTVLLLGFALPVMAQESRIDPFVFSQNGADLADHLALPYASDLAGTCDVPVSAFALTRNFSAGPAKALRQP